MARIRTIKPEFPQSESMGRVSRDARLLFIELWTIADDSGRTRAASRMLASLLFPYDDDAPGLIDSWLEELEAEGCITRYQVEGTTYLQIAKWLSHQKIDKPSASKFPSIDDGSRILASPRESSPLDQGPRTKEEEASNASPSAPPTADASRGTRLPKDWVLPDDWQAWAEAERPDLDATEAACRFRDFWVGKPGQGGRKADWQATWRNWVRNERATPGGVVKAGSRFAGCI